MTAPRVTREAAPVVERLAREKAWRNFLAEVNASLLVWTLDASVRADCESPLAWVRRCAAELDAIGAGA